MRRLLVRGRIGNQCELAERGPQEGEAERLVRATLAHGPCRREGGVCGEEAERYCGESIISEEIRSVC